jgi:membrane protease YdiL (CAAX protease family)
VGERVKGFDLAKLFVLFMGLEFLLILASMVLEPLLQRIGLSFTETYSNSMESLVSTPSGVLYIVLIGPIVEELVFRGAILRRLERFGANFAIVISALLFGLYHMIFFQVVYAFFVGLLLGYIAKRFSLKWAILLHIVNNSISVILGLIQIPAMAEYIFFGACCLGSIGILIADRKKFSAQKKEGAPAIAHPFHIAFTSPFLIILFIVLIAFGFYTLKVL